MKQYQCRSDLYVAFNSIGAIVEALCCVLEIANRADSETRHQRVRESGNEPAWAEHFGETPYNMAVRALNIVLRDKFEITEFVPTDRCGWGSHGTRFMDVFYMLLNNLVVDPNTLTASSAAE